MNTLLQDIYALSGAEHEHQYLHGGCPECGIFYDPDATWQHRDGCSRATPDQLTWTQYLIKYR